jgi:hypothetical protein
MNSKQKFKVGDLVQIIGATGYHAMHCLELLGVVCGISARVPARRFLVHTQSGKKHWFFEDELMWVAG